MRPHHAAIATLLLAALVPSGLSAEIRIGSKSFTESYVLAEIALGAMERDGLEAEHRPGMGGTIILWQALRSGSIDAYPDYSGTIGEQILKAPEPLSLDALSAELGRQGIGLTRPLGFDNTYALVMRRELALELALYAISDLATHPGLRVGLTHEFIERRDGWRPLAGHYGLEMSDVRGLEHALAYPALVRGELDVIDAYSTTPSAGGARPRCVGRRSGLLSPIRSGLPLPARAGSPCPTVPRPVGWNDRRGGHDSVQRGRRAQRGATP